MKKFVSIVTVLIVSISFESCREVEEISAVPEKKHFEQPVANKNMESSKESYKEESSTTTSNASNLTEDEGDPKKDKIKW